MPLLLAPSLTVVFASFTFTIMATASSISNISFRQIALALLLLKLCRFFVYVFACVCSCVWCVAFETVIVRDTRITYLEVSLYVHECVHCCCIVYTHLCCVQLGGSKLGRGMYTAPIAFDRTKESCVFWDCVCAAAVADDALAFACVRELYQFERLVVCVLYLYIFRSESAKNNCFGCDSDLAAGTRRCVMMS